jgi:hypothetical protein
MAALAMVATVLTRVTVVAKRARSAPRSAAEQTRAAALAPFVGIALFVGSALGAGIATGCAPAPPLPTHSTPAWQTVYDDKGLGGAFLSAWGTGARDVYLVGGPLGNGGATLVEHFDGEAWERLSPGGEDTFWWVSGSGPNDVWMSGENGRITHWDGAKFREEQRLTTATIWGLWAKSPTEAWAVGGTPGKGKGAPNDVVLRWDGAAWTAEALPGAPLGRSLNKVWGTSSEDLYAVGELGTVWHRVGAAWKLESEPPVAGSNLLTVYGCSAKDVYAVGGQDVIHSDGGGTWTHVDVDLSNAVNGVTCGAPGEVLLVGFGGLKVRRAGERWINEFDVAPFGDMHGAWSDGKGAFWVAGGDFLSKPAAGKLRKAIIARYGSGAVSTAIR